MGGCYGNRSFLKWEKACSASCVSGELSQKKAILTVNAPDILPVTTVSPLQDWSARSLKSSNPVVCDLSNLPGWFFSLANLLPYCMEYAVTNKHCQACDSLPGCFGGFGFQDVPQGEALTAFLKLHRDASQLLGGASVGLYFKRKKTIHAPINSMG